MPFEREEEAVLVKHGDIFGVPFSKPQTLNPKKKVDRSRRRPGKSGGCHGSRG